MRVLLPDIHQPSLIDKISAESSSNTSSSVMNMDPRNNNSNINNFNNINNIGNFSGINNPNNNNNNLNNIASPGRNIADNFSFDDTSMQFAAHQLSQAQGAQGIFQSQQVFNTNAGGGGGSNTNQGFSTSNAAGGLRDSMVGRFPSVTQQAEREEELLLKLLIARRRRQDPQPQGGLSAGPNMGNNGNHSSILTSTSESSNQQQHQAFDELFRMRQAAAAASNMFFSGGAGATADALSGMSGFNQPSTFGHSQNNGVGAPCGGAGNAAAAAIGLSPNLPGNGASSSTNFGLESGLHQSNPFSSRAAVAAAMMNDNSAAMNASLRPSGLSSNAAPGLLARQRLEDILRNNAPDNGGNSGFQQFLAGGNNNGLPERIEPSSRMYGGLSNSGAHDLLDFTSGPTTQHQFNASHMGAGGVGISMKRSIEEAIFQQTTAGGGLGLGGDLEKASFDVPPPPKKKRMHKKKPADMPRRPLSAYNLFFSEERERILKEMDSSKKDGDESDKGSDKEDESTNQETKQKDDDNKHTKSKPRALLRPLLPSEKKRRPHRKTHGKISFQLLAQMVGQRWKALPNEKRKYYQNLAQEDMKRQKQAMEEYYQKQTSDKGDKKSTTTEKEGIKNDNDESQVKLEESSN